MDEVKELTGVLLVNLGTPSGPDPSSVRRYLTEFLTDRRVIDMPWLKRQLLVRGVIIPSRYKSSAKSYQKVWTAQGSPLLVHGRNVQKALQCHLGDGYSVELAMRYQQPSMQEGLERLMEKKISRLVVLPLFPQYASATTGSVQQRLFELMGTYRVIPKITLIDHFFNHPKFIDAFCAVAKKHDLESYNHILFSFHGLPETQLLKADGCGKCLKVENCCKKLTKYNQNCYAAQCYATAAAIVEKLKIVPERYSICFQSRLGKEPWLSPSTSETIANCAQTGHKNLLIFSPSFVCDCLETLYEISIEYAQEFKNAGGERLDLVEGLNDHTIWIEALSDLVSL